MTIITRNLYFVVFPATNAVSYQITDITKGTWFENYAPFIV